MENVHLWASWKLDEDHVCKLEKQSWYYFDFKTNVFVNFTFWLMFCSSHNLPKVSLRDISQAHLISYHPEKDLLPMALASCNYSFEIGKEAQTEYNFKDLERQIMDKFLFSKSIICVKEVDIYIDCVCNIWIVLYFITDWTL